MLKEFQGLGGKPTYENSEKGSRADFDLKTDPIGTILFHPPYRISPREEEEFRRNIGKAICCSGIQLTRSDFGSPVLFVAKPDSTRQMWIDYRPVNAITVKDRYPLPHIKDLLNYMHGSCLFTKFDLAAGYHQIHIAMANRLKTAFTTTFGLYEWQVLPFGLANAPSQFMCMINGILEPMKWKLIVMYLDDSMITSCTLADHVVHVREVLTLLTKRGLKAKRANSAWVCQNVDFGGFEIEKDGIHAQEH